VETQRNSRRNKGEKQIMGEEIVCLARFCLPKGTEIDPDHMLAEYTVKVRGENDYYIIAEQSTCNASANSLREDVIETLKELNPIWIRGISKVELISDIWYQQQEKSR